MPRKAKIFALSALHHIIVRGIERRKIFYDDSDRENFLERFGIVLTESDTPCFKWALIPNYLHFFLRTGLTPIATVMRQLLTGYIRVRDLGMTKVELTKDQSSSTHSQSDYFKGTENYQRFGIELLRPTQPIKQWTSPIFPTAPSPTPTNVMVLLSEWEQQDENEQIKQMASTYKKQLLKQRG